MDRKIVYAASLPQDTDILTPEQNAMIAAGFALRAAFGTGTLVDGLAGVQTTVPSMTINVGPGSIIALEEIEATPFGSLPANTNALMKMGINTTSTPFTLTAPATSGQSINYLIEAEFAETDTVPVVLPYFNPSSPSTPFSGPNNTGAAQNTVRSQTVGLQLKAGAPATTGTQVTPATDTGWVPLYVITVNNGQTTVTTAQITVAPGAPFINYKIPQLTPTAWAPPRNLAANVGTAAATATFTADEISVETALGGTVYVLPGFSKTINLGVVGVGGMDTGAAPVSGFVSVYAIFNPASGVSGLLATNATASVAPSVYGGANMPVGFTASALVSVWPTNSSRLFAVATQYNRDIWILSVSVLSGTTSQPSYTALNISSAVPMNAKRITGGSSTIPGTGTSGSLIQVAASAAGVGVSSSTQQSGQGDNTFSVPIITPQTIFYITTVTSGTLSSFIGISGYTI
jgi:hypothetical protein